MTLGKYKGWTDIEILSPDTSGDSHIEVLPSDGAREETEAFAKWTRHLKQSRCVFSQQCCNLM